MMFYLGLLLAGGTGALLRYALGRFTLQMGWTALPFGTLMANAIGCFLIGYLSSLFISRFEVSQQLQVIVITGFLGGFTTFSAFSIEVLQMIQSHGNLKAMLYVVMQVSLCILLCFAGMQLAKQ